ncbi:MAG: DUF447 family protein [Betaproteobacteria bacterium]|nr:DUF447 family protein [Betaproteobacteria bacterium]
MNSAQRIFEAIVTTRHADGGIHTVPLGFRHEGDAVVLSPFRPSTTLDNILRDRHAVLNLVDDVRIFAGCLTGRHDWPTEEARDIPGRRLAGALAHMELRLDRVEDDPVRPRLICLQVHAETHAPFRGFNRAQAAVIEACILASRLGLLAEDKIRSEIAYLAFAIVKTAGPEELEAWGWVVGRIEDHFRLMAPGGSA